VTSRLIIPLLCLFLASCATTKTTQPETDPVQPATVQTKLPKGVGESIDEHLFVPETTFDETAETAPGFVNVWAKLVSDFSLTSCDHHEESLVWASWYAEHTQYMSRVMKRARPWIYFIANELEARHAGRTRPVTDC